MFELKDALENVKTVGISGHTHPDGDCVGACLGLYLYLKKYYPDLQTYVHLEDLPEGLLFLQGTDSIIHEKGEISYDVFFCLDCGDLERLGHNAILFQHAKRTVCIDHHVTHTLASDFSMFDPGASSASELVVDLLGTEKLTLPMAEALYTGIVHDTGVFRYDCTSQHTMELAGKLIDKGIDFTKIISSSFFSKSYLQMQILGRALLESMLILDGRVVFSALTIKDLKFYGVDHSDLGGIIDQLKNIRGVEAAIFLYQTGSSEWRVSMRSNDFMDVAKIANFFGGGGHKKAAGCTMQGSMHDVINNLTEHMEKQLQEKEAV